MEPLTLFKQNFAVSESLLQLYQVFQGLTRKELQEELRLAVCVHMKLPANAILDHAVNDRVAVLATSAARIPESLILSGGLDFLLRQSVVVACTALETFFWDVLRENVVTVIRARKSRADDTLKDISVKLGDFMSIDQYAEPEFRLQQVILKNFERGTLYGIESIDKITRILTVTSFWEQIEKLSGVPAASIKTQVGALIQRRNQIAHRADRPGEDDESDGHGLRPIAHAWAEAHVNSARVLVTASGVVIGAALKKLEADIRTSNEQAEARRLVGKA